MDLSQDLGPDAETIVHENGSKESKSPFAIDVVPSALLAVGRTLYDGEQKYGGDQNWRGIPVKQHLRHALNHTLAHLAGDRSEGDVGHLTHATCRLLFAIEVEEHEAETEKVIGQGPSALDRVRAFYNDLDGNTRTLPKLTGHATAVVTPAPKAREQCEARHPLHGRCVKEAGHPMPADYGKKLHVAKNGEGWND